MISNVTIYFFILTVLSVLLIIFKEKIKPLLWFAIKKIFYDNKIVSLMRNKILQVVMPSFTGAYYLCLDVWGNKLNFIKNYENIHEKIFFWLIGTSLVVLCIRGISDYIEEKIVKKNNDFVQQFVLLTSKVVREKLKRFKGESNRISQNGNTFGQITKPNVQINLLLTETVALFKDKLGIENDELGITILQKKPKGKSWFYKYKTNNNWNHTKPNSLFQNNSAAKECLELGEVIFHPEKQKAAKDGHYQFSERDKRHKNKGSIFCYPVKTKTPDYECVYIISIATYKKNICNPSDHQQADAIKIILTDICHRIDLELTLETIKEWHISKPRLIEGVQHV